MSKLEESIVKKLGDAVVQYDFNPRQVPGYVSQLDFARQQRIAAVISNIITDWASSYNNCTLNGIDTMVPENVGLWASRMDYTQKLYYPED